MLTLAAVVPLYTDMLPMDLWSLVLEPTTDIVFGDVEFMQCGGLFVWKCILVLENKSEDIRDL